MTVRLAQEVRMVLEPKENTIQRVRKKSHHGWERIKHVASNIMYSNITL